MTLRVHPDEIVAERPVGVLGIHRSWERVRLGAIADVLNGFAFPSPSFGSTGTMPLIRIRDVGRSSTDTWYSGSFDPQYVVQPGSLVVGMDGDFRASKWLGPPALLNQRVCKVTVRSADLYSPDFLSYALPGYLDAINRHTSAVTVKHLSSETVKELPLPLPPRAEQKRIVAAIEEQFSRLDAGMAALETVQQNLKRMRAAVLQTAVTGALSADWRASDSASVVGERTQKANDFARARRRVVELPVSWRWAELGDFVVEGPQNGLYLPASQYGRGTPILRITDFQDGWTQRRDALNLVAASPGDVAVFTLRVGDIVINRVNSMTHLGKCVVVTPDLAGAIFESNMMRLRVSDEMISEYLALYLQSDRGRSLLLANAKQAVNQASINQKDVQQTPIAVPPRDEQRAIISIYEAVALSVDNIAGAAQAASARARNLRSSVLAAAFSGRLVPQDPNDEPASVLLERIAAERVSSNGFKTTNARKPRTARPKVRV